MNAHAARTRVLTATAGAAAAVLLAGCAPAIGSGDDAGGSLPGISVVHSTPPPRVLGPDGLSKLRVGMTLDQAEATGEWKRREESVGSCMSDTGTNGITVGWSGKLGITYLTADNVHTPEGIGAGSTFAQVRAAYPKSALDDGDSLQESLELIGTVWTQVPHRPKLMYVFLFARNTVRRGDLDHARVQLVELKQKAEQRC
ncbi:hypothetical protein [Streptomyces mangrovisoli]|uniref:DUF3558 domain-containing protein n=1 Tax=Streptomyces mangrovisoli TaxID=1428628 RepID=A0A1J4NKY3_9ACTN|nr:hypothetical protein [Streptomyces mangrovisoli]OIJ62991.1 hypothetical protein WN71_036460 [Streptomyces mangrovisoli]